MSSNEAIIRLAKIEFERIAKLFIPARRFLKFTIKGTNENYNLERQRDPRGHPEEGI